MAATKTPPVIVQETDGQSTGLDVAVIRDVSGGRARDAVRRFYSLDVLRGVAALGVVLAHWWYFFYDGVEPGPVSQERLPLFGLLAPFYRNGADMVDLFFTLSGFIFFWLYADAVAARRISFKTFAVLRISRLYPLHLATLLVAFAGQWVIHALSGEWHAFVSTPDDFVRQLLLVHAWWLEPYIAFNGPSWSVSVELLLYLAFFALCRWNIRRWWQLAAIPCLAVMAMALDAHHLRRGLFSFFAGGLAFYAYSWVVKRQHGIRARVWLTGAVLAASAGFLMMGSELPYDVYRFVCGERLLIHGRDIIGGTLLASASYALTGLIFPLLILLLALAETTGGPLGRRWGWLGDISYGCYLWHFPLQLGAVILIHAAGASREVFYSPLAMAGFLGVLLGVSFASHRWFEVPVQNLLRRKFLPRGNGQGKMEGGVGVVAEIF